MSDSSTRPESDGGTTVVHGADVEVASVPGGSVLRQVRIVAGQEYRLAMRNRWSVALTGLFLAFGGLLTAFGGSRVGPTDYEVVVVSLASLATYLLPLAALVFGYDAVVGADEAGWLDVVFALPVARSTVVIGTYLGRAATLAAATAVGFGAVGGWLLLQVGVGGWPLYARFLLAAVGVGVAFLSVSLLLSTVAAEKTHALGLALLAWVWFVLAHDLLALGAVATFDLPDAGLSALVLANPADVFRLMVLQGVHTSGGGLAAVVADTGLSTPVLVGGLLVWCVAPVLAAARLVRRRSL